MTIPGKGSHALRMREAYDVIKKNLILRSPR